MAVGWSNLAYSLMEVVSTEWGIKAYFRVARYYHLAGRYEDALSLLQKLHDNVDIAADAREKLYKEWGWMQKGGPAKTNARRGMLPRCNVSRWLEQVL